jgi:hypothetical protein
MADEMKWELLDEVQGRLEAEALKSFFEAEGVPVQLIQEGAGEFGFAMTVGPLGLVQVFVPKEKIAEARALRDAFNEGDTNPEIADDETDDNTDEGT